MTDKLRSKTVDLGGQERTLRLTAGHVRFAQLKGVEVLPESVRSNDLLLGAHLVYIALLPSLEEDTGEDEVMRWLMEVDDTEAICAWAIDQYLDATEALGNSIAPRHQKRLEARKEEMLNRALARLGLTSTSSTE